MISAAYLDTSAFLSVAFKQKGGRGVLSKLAALDQVISCDLIISEALSACRRESVPYSQVETWFEYLNIIHAMVDESLVRQVLDSGYLRGADLHHLAAALWFVEGHPRDTLFVSLDEKQSKVAQQLGFMVL